jgi:hypothetical protein
MKRSLLLILLFTGLHTLHAQTPDTTLQPGLKKPDPAKRAARQLRMLENQLHLTQDQVLQIQVILITETVALDSIRNNQSGPRSDNRARREVLKDADSQIMPLLTDQQKQLYQQWKAQQKQRMMQRRQNNGNNNPDDSPYNSQ